MRLAAAIGAGAVMLAGCASLDDQVKAKDEALAAKRSLAGPNALVPVKLERDKAMSVAIGDDEGVIEVGGRKVFARLIALPEMEPPYSLSITSPKVGAVGSPGVFYPQVTLLDAAFKRTRVVDPAEFRYRGLGLVATVFANNDNRNERFVLIHEQAPGGEVFSNAASQGVIPVGVPIGPVFVMWMIPTGGGEKPTPMRGMRSGTVSVELSAYRPRRLDEAR